MEDYGNGWYRCSITFDIDKSVDKGGYIHIAAMDGDNSNTYAAIGQGFYAYGSQGEELSYPTSYIPTGGAFATRNQELCNNATPVINSEEGTLYAEISALDVDDLSRYISITDGVLNNNAIRLLYHNSSGTFFQKYVNGVRTTNLSTSSIVKTDFNKIAIRYNSTSVSVFVNGVNILNNADTNIITPNTLSKLSFDIGTPAQSFFGNTKGLKYYPKALADVQLEDLTTI